MWAHRILRGHHTWKMGKEAYDNILPTLRVIAFTLQEAASQNKLLIGRDVTLSRFHTLSPPKIPILKYLGYLHTNGNCPRSVFIVALILLDRLLIQQPQIKITPNTVHKLFLCSLLTASKFTTDMYYNNITWATIGGLRLEELNVLELEFLFLLRFTIVVTKEEFNKYDHELSVKASLPEFHEG